MFLIFLGICVAAPLEVQVVKDIFLSIHVPYSVVRGEQIGLKGFVYNYKASAIKVICGFTEFYGKINIKNLKSIPPTSIQYKQILGSDCSSPSASVRCVLHNYVTMNLILNCFISSHSTDYNVVMLLPSSFVPEN